MEKIDSTATLTIGDLPAEASTPAWGWQLVIVFHSQASHIGAAVVVPDTAPSLFLGRHSPTFASYQGPPLDLADRAVSRQAAVLERSENFWCLRRVSGRSRLRVDGEELSQTLSITPEDAQRGLVLCLGEHVVLHLRYQPLEPPSEAPPLRHEDTLRQRFPGVSRGAFALRAALDTAIAASDDVLLLGPTGTGKERVARAIHELARPEGPWVAVNMAALPPDIAAASLFGVRRGAYTGADKHRQGYFQEADGGVLFLDEIGDASEALQSLLLRALEEREVQVLGGATERVQLRVIGAMEFDPLERPFRAALRYRLGSCEVRLAPLQQRLEDLGLLVLSLLEAEGEGWQLPWCTAQGVTLQAWVRVFETMALYAWPGNIRELRNVLRQLRGQRGLPSLPDALRPSITEEIHEVAPREVAVADAALGEASVAVQGRLRELSDEDFIATWHGAGCEVAAVARTLGVSRASVYRRVKRTRACRLAADVPLKELQAALQHCAGSVPEAARYLGVSVHGLATRLRAGVGGDADDSPTSDTEQD